MTVTRGKEHNFLGMDIVFHETGRFQFNEELPARGHGRRQH